MADKRSKSRKKGGSATMPAPAKDAANQSAHGSQPKTEAEQPVCEAKAEQPACEAKAEQPACEAKAEQPACEAKAEQPACEAKMEQPACQAETEQPAGEEPKLEPERKKQHHVSSILDAVLSEEIPEDADTGMSKRFRYPVYVDALLGFGLLLAVAGFTIGLFKMYVTHQAQQHIMQGDYRTAIAILQSTPMPQAFSMDGSDPQETLSQALYLDALQKFQEGHNNDAWAELQQIRAGSKYFDQSQRLLGENFVPSNTILQCGVTEETVEAKAP